MFVVALCSGVLVGHAARADFKEGWKAYKAGNFRLAYERWRPVAEGGDARSQMNFGMLYMQGRGVEKDPNIALEWFEKAAKQNYASAQYNAGHVRATIKGKERSQKQAAIWFHEAAKRGHAGAQYQLARRYEKGGAVKKNLVRALYWTILSEARAKKKLKARVVKLRERLVAGMSEEKVAEAMDLVAKAEARRKKAKSKAKSTE